MCFASVAGMPPPVSCYPLFYHDRPPHSRKIHAEGVEAVLSFPADRLHAQFFHTAAAGVWKRREKHSIHAGLSPKTTTENCMDYPFWNELSFLQVSVCENGFNDVSPFHTGFTHPVEESPIQAVMDAAAFWKFVGKNVGNLPFIKKKVEGFSFVFTVYSGLRVCFSPIWNFAGSFSTNRRGEKPGVENGHKR